MSSEHNGKKIASDKRKLASVIHFMINYFSPKNKYPPTLYIPSIVYNHYYCCPFETNFLCSSFLLNE